MKKILLFTSLIVSTLAFGQKKLMAVSEQQMNDSGQLTYTDSTSYTYNSWYGSLTANEAKPVFGYEGDILGYILKERVINCDQDQQFYGSSYPLTPGDITTNTIANQMVTEAVNGGGFNRNLYEYNALGQVTKKTGEYLLSSIWTVQDSTVFTYDNIGNQLTEMGYNVSSTIGLTSADSMWYQAGTNKIIKGVSYYSGTGVPLEIASQSLMTYVGNNVEHVDLHESDGLGGLDWVYRLNYNYTGSILNDFIAYDVLNNIPTTTVFATGYFTYSGQNDPASYLLILQGDTLGEVRWEYDADGFISKKIEAETDVNDNLYDANITTYTFQNTAGLNEGKLVEVSIFPNPTSDILNIEAEGELVSVSVLDLNGRILIKQNSSSIDVRHLSKGNYILKGTTSLGDFSEKFIKK